MKISQAILPVAGLGTRFMPWTKAVPKEMLPLGNQPIIAHLVHECLDVGITDICFVISKGKESIPAYFTIEPALEEELKKRGKFHLVEELMRYDSVNFHTVYQDEQHGDGHAILQAADWVGDGTIAILFGDDLFTGPQSALQQMIRAYEKLTEDERGAIVALEKIPPEDTLRYGIVEVESEHPSSSNLKKIKGLVEKPEPQFAPSDLGIVGRYLIPRSVIDVLPEVETGHGGEIRLIDALTKQLNSIPIYGYECTGKRIDTGHPEGYAKAVSIFSVEE
ncbi:UTP--glucose-1-phosphate uridylyltransferase [Candidatus Peregrinibacteria bacterium CG10_big_fil_rev_8_21_14_0_10_49_24]|nr:MAG: UTP--glucose-1-phosphate uridylyltransferase [Candidatus Peregrinibacteria bacterium CG11_big_fil_rev_8_21_14_0_20_49_14]PIR50579.1 MAG: UTP--glucose-1-phosphate uridylyltransferase [Candidatus Peregrinibacteria bacterium CG10_big_fil_rev_8_21_14_0_10_49_24]PJA67102.1 MAG: UTP--glucose-1-phosphate uridylyltransferase [Candidatus Peregrinibacteria bacterium CG_4_9_14_3_um_filter_49_12]